MKVILSLVKRNIKLFFKDKGTFFTALITPIILLVLYVTFLYNVYKQSFADAAGVPFEGGLMDGLVGGLLLSSLLAVSTVTVSFCANLGMVADKVTGARGDLTISPAKPYQLAIGYYLSTVVNGLIISFVATLLGCIYLACVGWYLSFADVVYLILDVILLTLFGTAFSSVICYPLTTQGQLSAAGSIVSAGYGFICGAYMPMSQFPSVMQKILSFFPGTYGTTLLRNHALGGVFDEMASQNFPQGAIDGIQGVADCKPQFFGRTVEMWQMYLVLIAAIILLLGLYILLHTLGEKKRRK